MSTSGAGSRFTAPNQTTDQRLSTNVVGLVELSDFRKRRAEVLEQLEREARELAKAGSTPGAEGGNDESGDSATAPDAGTDSATGEAAGTGGSEAEGGPAKKKKKTEKTKDGKKKKKGGKISKLSFLGDDEDEEEDDEEEEKTTKTTKTIKKTASAEASASPSPSPSATSGLPPIKSFTQQALRRQAAEREALRKEFLALQTAVKASEVAIPFVFYEGANIPGGVVRVRKGDFVWLFLDRSRKVGARLGVGEKRHSKARLHWARINVDDLMLVRGNLIIPHHYDIYFFLINKTLGPGGERVFNYSSDAPTTTTAVAPLSAPRGNGSGTDKNDEEEDFSHLEGASDDPGLTKVVDRRWYERNKHIYPASLWQEFDPEQDYVHQVRRDQGGNAFFFTAK